MHCRSWRHDQCECRSVELERQKHQCSHWIYCLEKHVQSTRQAVNIQVRLHCYSGSFISLFFIKLSSLKQVTYFYFIEAVQNLTFNNLNSIVILSVVSVVSMYSIVVFLLTHVRCTLIYKNVEIALLPRWPSMLNIEVNSHTFSFFFTSYFQQAIYELSGGRLRFWTEMGTSMDRREDQSTTLSARLRTQRVQFDRRRIPLPVQGRTS